MEMKSEIFTFSFMLNILQVDIPDSQIYALKEGLSVEEAAKEYEGQLLRIPQSVLPRNSEGVPYAPIRLSSLAAIASL